MAACWCVGPVLQCAWWAPRLWALALVAALLAQACWAAGQGEQPRPGQFAAASTVVGARTAASATSGARQPLWQRYNALFPPERLIPVVTRMRGHDVVYQIPDNPRGTLFIAPGCNHAAHDWWPASAACPECLGLPEEIAHTQQALARGFAVISMSSINVEDDMCMEWKSNHKDAVAILKDFMKQHKLRDLPLYGLGVSVGGGFVAKLAGYIKMDGVVSEVLGPKPLEWNLNKYKFGIPPIVFISMDMDPPMAARISADSARLRQRGAVTETVRVAQRVVYPTFFSDRSSRVSPEVSAKVVAALHEIGMLDEKGLVTVDPRHTKRPWVRQLLTLVPELDGGMTEDHSQVWEEMNLAYSCHEIIADFTTPALMWFESRAKANFAELVAKYAAPGNSGSVGDAAGAISPAAAAMAAAGQPRVQQPYEKHEAKVAQVEAAASEETDPASPLIKPGGSGPAQQASSVRVLGATVEQAQLQPPVQLQGQRKQQAEANPRDGASLVPGGQAMQNNEPSTSTVSAASMTAAASQASQLAGSSTAGSEAQAAAPGSAAAAAQGAEAATGSGEMSSGAIIGCTVGAAAGVTLLLAVFRLAKKPARFNKLPLSEPRHTTSSFLASAGEQLPVSTRLAPIPELPETPSHRSTV